MTTKKSYLIHRLNDFERDDFLIEGVLKLQKDCQFKEGGETNSGFLFTQWSKSELHDLLNEGCILSVITEKDRGEVLGYMLTSPIKILEEYIKTSINIDHKLLNEIKNSPAIYLYQIAIKFAFRKCGLGKLLFENRISEICKFDIYLDIMKSPYFNKASHEFFTKLNFKNIASIEHDNYRGGGACHWIVMKRQSQKA